MLLDEDAQDLSEPILKPVKPKTFSVLESEAPELNVDLEFQKNVMLFPHLCRNVAIVGHFHHGKTLFMDTLVQQTHVEPFNPNKETRYTDTRKDEQERGFSVKSTPVSLILPNTNGKSFMMNIMDCPGHPTFCDEASAGMRASDGVVVIIDAVEGCMMNTNKMIEMAMLERLPIVLVINKVDRLILELKLPPQDAYFKLNHTIEEVNTLMSQYFIGGVGEKPPRVSPERGNVCFASAAHGWCFSLLSFTKIYTDYHSDSVKMSPKELALRMWGDAWLDPFTRTFVKKLPKNDDGSSVQRTFVQYLLEPLYKIYSAALGEEPDQLAKTCREVMHTHTYMILLLYVYFFPHIVT